MTTIKRIGVLVALFALLVMIPQPASAQLLPAGCDTVGRATLEANISGGDRPIVPIRQTEELTLNWNWKTGQGWSIAPVEINFREVRSPSWATVTILQQNAFAQWEGNEAGFDENGRIAIRVTVEPSAPAFARDNIVIGITSSDGDCVTEASVEAPIEIQAGFYERWQARFEQSIHRYGQNTHFQIPLRIDNAGNGMLEIEVRQIRDEENRHDRPLTVVTPGGFHQVGSDAQGASQNHQTLPIDVQTPFRNGYLNERLQLAIEITGRSADDHDVALTPARLDATIQTQGVYVPGFPVVFALLALLGVAMLQTKRREE